MDNSLATIFGQVLKERRNEIGISQEKLAYESELDRSFISMMERGLRMPTLSTVFQICKVLKTTPSEIMKLIEQKYDSV